MILFLVFLSILFCAALFGMRQWYEARMQEDATTIARLERKVEAIKESLRNVEMQRRRYEKRAKQSSSSPYRDRVCGHCGTPANR